MPTLPMTELDPLSRWTYKVRLGRARRWTATMHLAGTAADKTLTVRILDRQDRQLATADLDPETLRVTRAAIANERAYWLLVRALAAYKAEVPATCSFAR